MPYRLETLKQGAIAHLIFQDPVETHDIMSAVESLWAEGRVSCPCRLWDFRGCQAEFSFPELRSFAADAKPMDREPGRIAILVDKEVQFGQARVHQAYRSSSLVEERVFLDFDAAVEWLESFMEGTP